MTAEEPARLFRLGTGVETAGDLEALCEEAVRRGFPHGGSALSEIDRDDACVAARDDVELYFRVEKTGRRSVHYTIVLPHPVTDLDAAASTVCLGASNSEDHGRD